MKPVLELLAASALSVGMVIGGVVVASAALAPEDEPHHFADLEGGALWTSQPVRIDRDNQDLERLPPRYASSVVMSAPEPATQTAEVKSGDSDFASEVASIDLVETGSVSNLTTEMSGELLSPQHVSWCQSRYRSYDRPTNTYRSYGGEVRDCTSPYQIGASAAGGEGEAELMTVNNDQATYDQNSTSDVQVRACMERYRSYRASDNTYQPYGGGPRQQCIMGF